VQLSAGLTPAWQQILAFDTLRWGQVNRARDVVWCASGKVFNAGIAAHHLGGPSLTLAPVGGPALPHIEAEFQASGVPYRWVHTQAATRICTTIIDRSTGEITELVENGRALTDVELEQFRQAYAAAAAHAQVAVLIGSLPVGTPESFYRDLLERTPCPAVLDFRGAGLLAVLDLQPYVVKPNREELAKTVGRPLQTDEDLIATMRTLNDRGAQWVVITQGAGSVWASSSHELYRLQPVRVRDVVNPIASGDALSATIGWATRAGRPLVDAVRLGLAAAAQNVRQLLPCRLDPTRLESETAAVTIERLE
jgi:1-phosphofructokinase family hexose kinase